MDRRSKTQELVESNIMARNEEIKGDQGNGRQPKIPDHDLLRPIGQGSYGHVWLARNAVGAFRAVKVVYRDQFEDERPYEREYGGLKLFEPVSRSHEGLVDILHLGRNDQEGYFFYIMEAADDALAGQQIDPKEYLPRTLEREIKKRKRLPAVECAEISAALAAALAHLHQSKLVHRDVKPGNIIFVNGVPKLADIGLVTLSGSARTFVGTEGFVPPEGPGTPQADIYSLGKVMYEVAMGKDRQAFPSMPTMLDEFPDREATVELNGIITRACEPDARRRYKNAEELRRDLVVLHGGGKPSRLLRNRQRMALAAKLAAALVVVGSVALAAEALLGRRAITAGSAERAWQLKLVRKIELPGISAWGGAKIGYFDGDGEPSIVVAKSNLFIASLQVTNWHSWPLPSSADLGSAAVEVMSGLYGPGRDGISLGYRENGTNICTRFFNGSAYVPRLFETKGSLYKGEPASFMYGSQLLDLKQNNSRQLVVIKGTTWEEANQKANRGLFCYEFEHGTSVWEFVTAPYVHHAIPIRLISTAGPLDLIFGSNATCNGRKLDDGTDDSHSYLFAVSADGKGIWTNQVGDDYTYCEPLVLPSLNIGEAYEILVRVAAPGRFRTNEVGSILKYDTAGRLLTNYDAGVQLRSFAAVDLKNDGKIAVLATDTHGFLHVLDRDLQSKARIEIVPRQFTNRLDAVAFTLNAIEDLNEDGQKEVVLRSTQIQVLTRGGPQRRRTREGPGCICPGIEFGF